MEGIDPYDFELLIFDRWGQIVWESHDITVAWDGMYKGKPLQEGMYNWIVRTKDILNDGEIEAQVKKVKLKFKSNVKEALVSANLTQLQSALENIVRNAIKYTDEDTYVNIEISEMNKKNINEFNLEVSDSGPGVPNEDLKKIFEPFYRVDQARNRKTGGFGIGLSIVKRVIKAHGGRIEAINQNKGLTIKISLPKANV